MKRSKIAFPCKFPIKSIISACGRILQDCESAIKRFSTRQEYLGVEFLS
jgi:hypothetical protein